MNKKFILPLLGIGLIIPHITSCSAPVVVDKVVIEGKDKIEIGETSSFKAEIYPASKSGETVEWSVSDNNIAYVDNAGNITGVNKGKTTITAKVGKTESKQDLYIGGYIDNPISSIAIKDISALKIGEYKQLEVDFTPNNTSNKDVTWYSEDPRIASVSKYGVIKGENFESNNNKVKIWATSKADSSKKAFIEVIVNNEQVSTQTIKSFSEPDCLTNYKDKISHLEPVIKEKEINRTNSSKYFSNNYYVNDEDKQIYKVGYQNPFKFKCNLTTTTTDDPFKEIKENNPYQEYRLLDESGSEVSKSTYIESDYKGNEFKFKDTAKDKIFTLEVKPDSRYNPDPSMVASLKIKVIDAYNVYDFAGLTAFDNWTSEYANTFPQMADYMKTGRFTDLWSNYKKEHNIANPIGGFNGIVLHNNIEIKNEDIPTGVKWTEKEADDFINGTRSSNTKEAFKTFAELKENVHQEEWKDLPDNVINAKLRYMLANSRCDSTGVFTRQMSNNFTFEGNYFSIDESNVKPAVFFRVHVDDYRSTIYNYVSLFNFGLDRRVQDERNDMDGLPAFDIDRPCVFNDDRRNNLATVNNLTIIGNAKKDGTHDEGLGGDASFTAASTNAEFNNVHSISSRISFSNVNWNDDSKIQKITLNKCKSYDTFSEYITQVYNCNTTINDSIFKDASACGIRMVENQATNSGPTVDFNNTYMEAFITGNETINKNSGLSYAFKIINLVGLEAFSNFKDVKFGKDGTYAPKTPGSFIKVEDDIVYSNLTILHFFDNPIEKKTPGYARMSVNGQGDVFNLQDDGKEGSPINYYNNMSLVTSLFNVCFKSSAGGHARLPILETVSAEDLEVYDENIPHGILSKPTLRFSEYKNNKDTYDNDSSYDGAIKTMANLFSGDYLATYIKLLDNYPFVLTLSYK